MHRVRSGEAGAFRELVQAWQGPLFGLLARLVPDREVAAELTQEAFLRAFSAFERFQTGSRLRPWLFRIARNLAIDHLRSLDHRMDGLRTEGDPGELSSPVPSADQRFDDARLLARVEAALTRLRPAHREALVLHAIEGLPYKEIAEITGDSVASIKVRVVRARVALRRILEGGADDLS